MGLKKFLKKARKAVGLPPITLGNVGKLGIATAIGGPAGLAAGVIKSKLKSAAIGGIKQALRAKSQRAQLKKIGTLQPPQIVGIKSAVSMPGGAPLRGERKAAALPGLGGVLQQQARTRPRRRKVAAAKAKAPRKARKAPTGGKDFKALSASWKAAGKPGKWIDWVKSH